jgi:hypothetical protein
MRINRCFLAIGLILTLATTVVAPALAQSEEFLPASVTVTQTINFTIVDGDSLAGINFGSVTAGMTNVADSAQLQSPPKPAVTLHIGSDTNVSCSMQVKGQGDFTNGNGESISLSQAKWNQENMATQGNPMSTSYNEVATSQAGLAGTGSVWHWLSVPSTAKPGTYTTNFYYQAVRIQ